MSTPNVVIGQTSGLSSHPNEFTAELGATVVADNYVFNREGMPERRNGFADFSTNLPDFNPTQLLTGSNGTDRYLMMDGGLWYYDTTNTRWTRKQGDYISTFYRACAIWVDSSDATAYLTDSGGHAIYKVDLTTGFVSLFAGKQGTSGTTSGTGAAARFNTPAGIWGDGTNLYVCDSGNFSIRKIVIATGAVTDFAGLSGTAAHTDNTGTAARFQSPWGIWSDGTNLYVTEKSHGYIRKIVTSSQVVTTLTSGLTSPKGIWVANAGTTIYVSVSSASAIRTVNASTGADSAFVSGLTGDAGADSFLGSDGTYLWQTTYDNQEIDRITISGGAVSKNFFGLLPLQYVVGIYASTGKLYVCGTSNTAGALLVAYPSTLKNYYLVTTSVAGAPSTSGTSRSIIKGPDASSTARRIRSFEMLGNTYFSTSSGIVKSTSLSANTQPAGLPRALDPAVTEVAGTVFTAASQTRAYRIVWGLRDANNNLVLGDRSGRVVYTSTAGSKTAELSFPIPPEITTSHIYQVYATAIGTGSADPGDVMVEIYENFPTSTQITNGSITYDDAIPDAFRNVGTPLYTNTEQEGGAAGNAQPPLARDICEFRNFAFYANYTDKHRMTMQLVDAASLVAATSTVTIGGIVYACDSTETISTGTWKKYTGGTAAQNVEDTARSLCRVINGYAATTGIYATYVSTPNTVPGEILIEERGIGGSAFVAIANNSTCGNCFVPPLPTSGSTYTSVADRRKNRIRVSKYQQPEHVPIARDLIVGAENDEIQRVIPLRDSVVVIKDRTVWRITGSVFEDFVATKIDDTTSCAGRDSYSKLNNTIFGLSNQGFIAITDNGVQIVGRPEEQRVLAGLATKNAPDHDTFVGVGDEVRRLYLCRAYDAAASKNVTYAYNAITRQWSRWLIDPDCLSVAGDRIYYGLNNALGHVLQERDSRRDGAVAYRDMADEAATFTISSIDTTAKTATGTFAAGVDYTGSTYTDSIGYGWKLYDGANQYLVLSEAGGVLTLNTVTGLTTGAKTVYRPIPTTIEWAPIIAGNPGELKQWGDYVLRCETQNAYKASVSFANERDTKTDPVATTWVAQPTATDAYISTDDTPSATNNDFTATPGNVVPANTIRGRVDKLRGIGQQLSVRVYHSVAESRFSPKALVLQARSLESNAGKR